MNHGPLELRAGMVPMSYALFLQFVNCHIGPIQANTYFFADLLTDVCAFFWWLLHCLDLSFKSIHFLMKFLLALPALFHRHVPHLITQTPETKIVATSVLWPLINDVIWLRKGYPTIPIFDSVYICSCFFLYLTSLLSGCFFRDYASYQNSS